MVKEPMRKGRRPAEYRPWLVLAALTLMISAMASVPALLGRFHGPRQS